MKSFKQFLKEKKEKTTPVLIPAPLKTIKPSAPTIYSDPTTGVRSYFHRYNPSPLPFSSNTPKTAAYWGYGVDSPAGIATDKPQTGLSPTQKSQISRTARGHMENFLKSNSEVKKITYQTNPDAQGALNKRYFQDKMWPEMQTKTGTKASFLEVPKNPLIRRPPTTAAASVGAGTVGSLVGEYLVKPAAEKAGVFNAVEKGTRAVLSRMPNWAADVANVGLGAAQVALDPIGSYNEFLVNQARKSPKLTAKNREEAEARFNKQNF